MSWSLSTMEGRSVLLEDYARRTIREENRAMKEKMTSPPSGGQVPSNETVEGRYDSRELFRDQQEILIEHAGNAYRLRITRQDKLILTK